MHSLATALQSSHIGGEPGQRAALCADAQPRLRPKERVAKRDLLAVLHAQRSLQLQQLALGRYREEPRLRAEGKAGLALRPSRVVSLQPGRAGLLVRAVGKLLRRDGAQPLRQGRAAKLGRGDGGQPARGGERRRVSRERESADDGRHSLCEGGEGAAAAEEPLEQLSERADDAPAEHLVRRRREELRRPARGRRREGGEPRK